MHTTREEGMVPGDVSNQRVVAGAEVDGPTNYSLLANIIVGQEEIKHWYSCLVYQLEEYSN